MGIFSFFARKCVVNIPSSYDEKPPSSSSALSSHSDSTDSVSNVVGTVVDEQQPPLLMIEHPPPLISRPCLKSFVYNGIKHYGTNSHSMAVLSSEKNDYFHDIDKAIHRVQFAPSLEEVYLIENYSNDPSLELWSTRADYTRRHYTDLSKVVKEMSLAHIMDYPKKRPHGIDEQEYLSACKVAYHQFCLTGSVDKGLQGVVLRGIECGYRSLERFTSDHHVRRELSNRIRKSTVLLYRSLIHHRKESQRTGQRDNTDTYLRSHIESLNYHHIRWALFLGRLDRMAARRCMNTPPHGKASVPTYQLCVELPQQHETCSVQYKTADAKDCGSASPRHTLPLHDDVLSGNEGSLVVLN